MVLSLQSFWVDVRTGLFQLFWNRHRSSKLRYLTSNWTASPLLLQRRASLTITLLTEEGSKDDLSEPQ
jgi:hypothetical protein